MLANLIGRLMQGGRAQRRADGRGGRIVVAIECLLNQNARDAGAACSTAMAWEVIELCRTHDAGVVQMPCPEMACLGPRRTRPAGHSIRQAMLWPAARAACTKISTDVADRIQAYAGAGCRVLAVLGGNPQSPGCAVHQDAEGLLPTSGVLMLELQAELRRRALEIPFRGMRDSDAALLKQDLEWLGRVLSAADAAGTGSGPSGTGLQA